MPSPTRRPRKPVRSGYSSSTVRPRPSAKAGGVRRRKVKGMFREDIRLAPSRVVDLRNMKKPRVKRKGTR